MMNYYIYLALARAEQRPAEGGGGRGPRRAGAPAPAAGQRIRRPQISAQSALPRGRLRRSAARRCATCCWMASRPARMLVFYHRQPTLPDGPH
jgi:hypothetical protein